VFWKFPTNFAEMTDEQQLAWCRRFVEAVMAANEEGEVLPYATHPITRDTAEGSTDDRPTKA